MNEWQRVDQNGLLYRARYQADFGAPYSLLVRLPENRFLVYSPGRGQVASVKSRLSDTPEITLIAPALGHTLGLASWREQFPQATAVCAARNSKRLIRKTGFREFTPPETVNDRLPKSVQLLTAPENVFGELWLRVETDEEQGTIYWAVCDSLMNLPELGNNPFTRFMLRWYGLDSGLHVHQRFRAGLSDRPGFREWALERFEAGRRHVLVPCHGDVFRDPESQLRDLIIRHFPEAD